MMGRDTLITTFVFVVFNIVMIAMFSYSYMENIYSDACITQNKETEIHNIYPSARISPSKGNTLFMWGDVGISSDFIIHRKISETEYLVVYIPEMIKEIQTNKYYIMLVVVLIINSAFMYYNIIYRRKVDEKQRRYIENKLQFQTTMILTENLHHEMNTPLLVISNKLNKMSSALMSLQNKESDIMQTKTDFKAIDASIIIMRDILDRLKSIKHLRVYETHRTYHEVIKSSCEMIKISNSDHFEYIIDEKFKEYKVDGKYMKNGELSGILLNLIKNSVEANATNITFSFGGYDGSKCIMYIGDNGNGIPENICKEVFKENFTSKHGIRGNGLYINKFLIENAKGTLKLVESSSLGTAFELKLFSVKSSDAEIERANDNEYDMVKQLETDIVNRDILFQQFIDSLPDMAWLKDKEGKYLIANRAIKEGLLFDDNPIGKHDIEMALKAKERFGNHNHTFGEKCSNSDVITLENEEPSRFLESGKVKGEMMYLEVYKNIIKDREGNIIGVCGTGRDLTEYMEAIRMLELTCGTCSVSDKLTAFNKYLFGEEETPPT